MPASPDDSMPDPTIDQAAESSASARASDAQVEVLESAMSRHHYSGDALVEVLHDAQGIFGCLTPEILDEIARKLELPIRRVLDVATFCHYFSPRSEGEHLYMVCLGKACLAKGASELLETVEHRLSNAGLLSRDGKVRVHPTSCIGVCELAPAVIRDGEVVGRLTPERLEADLDAIGVERPRQYSETDRWRDEGRPVEGRCTK